MTEAENQGIEEQIQSTLRSRFQHFKDQTDSLTSESVRRLLEKDLGLQKFALDVHTNFITVNFQKLMESDDDCNSKPSTETVDNDADLSKDATVPQEEATKKSPKRSGNKDEEVTEDSPIMGVLAQQTDASAVNESMIQKAISDRADHFLANTEVLTLAGVRRLLEEDLQLEKFALDPFKKFISAQIDQVLNPPKVAKSSRGVKKKASGNAQRKKDEKISRKEGVELSSSESEMMEEKVESTKVTAPRKKNKTLEEPKSRKRPKESDIDDSGKKQNKLIKRQKEEDSDSDNPGSLSEDVQPQLSNRKTAQKGKPASGYGKHVERLKSIIKACGLSVGPTIYKKAKEVPDNRREAFLVKELEGILSREGLSKDPSEKEIKDCKKRRDTARELEGIDMSNIVSSSRRRSTFSFVAPPKVDIRAKAKKIVGKDDENKENNEKEHNDDNEEKDAKNEKEVEEEEEQEEEEEEEEEDDDEAEEDESEEFNDGYHLSFVCKQRFITFQWSIFIVGLQNMASSVIKLA